MRRINALVSMAVMLLFLIHMIWGGLELAGLTKGGSKIFTGFSYALLVLLCIHIVIGIKLTVDTVIAARRSGTFYWKQNRLFLLRRISGFALIFFIMVHVLIFQGTDQGGVYRLKVFDLTALVTQILLVVSLLLHLLTNITPLKIAMGFSDEGNLRTDAALVLAILLVLAGIAFLAYYLRWQVI